MYMYVINYSLILKILIFVFNNFNNFYKPYKKLLWFKIKKIHMINTIMDQYQFYYTY